MKFHLQFPSSILTLHLRLFPPSAFAHFSLRPFSPSAFAHFSLRPFSPSAFAHFSLRPFPPSAFAHFHPPPLLIPTLCPHPLYPFASLPSPSAFALCLPLSISALFFSRYSSLHFTFTFAFFLFLKELIKILF